MVNLKDDFRDWLIKQGLSEKTASGRPSTIYDYLTAINRVCKKERYSWEDLAINLFSIVSKYHGKYKTALYKYNTFLFESDCYAWLQNNKPLYSDMQITCLKTIFNRETGKIEIDDPRDDFSPLELASEWKITTRTLKKWRKDGKGPKYIRIGGRIKYLKVFIEEYYNTQRFPF